tara:strand:- start:330 stop:557 length:228 start_codon:yes stop_codon:yes gene_type:complete
MKIVYSTVTNEILYMMPDTDTVTMSDSSVTLVRSDGSEDITTVLPELNNDNAATATVTAEELLMSCDLSVFRYLG